MWLAIRSSGLSDRVRRLSRAGCRWSGQSDLGRGRSGDTCVGCVKKSCLAGLGQLHRWDAPATPWFVGWLAFYGCRSVLLGTLRRYCALGVWSSCTCKAGLPRLGRFGDTIRLWVGFCFANGCMLVPLGTLCDTMRWAGLGRVAKGWDVSTTPPRCSFPDDR